MFDGWFVKISGSGLLFTSEQDRASGFTVSSSSGLLCSADHQDSQGRPWIGAVGLHNEPGSSSSAVWMLRRWRLEHYDEDYVPVKCSADETLSCTASASGNGTLLSDLGDSGRTRPNQRNGTASIPTISLNSRGMGMSIRGTIGRRQFGGGNGTTGSGKTFKGAASHWFGCGMQLELGLEGDGDGTGPGRGLNCTSVGLGIVSI